MDGLNILPSQIPTTAAPNAGADLRMARERLEWRLEDAAATLRIRRAYLEALEQGDLSLLPGNAFALCFLRSYAAALGLDPDEMLRRFKAEAAEVSRRTELAFPAPVPERGLPTGAVMLLGLILAVGAYIGWYRLSGEGRLPAETATTIPERLAPLAEQALPPATPSPAAAQAAPVMTPAAPPVAAPPAPAPAVVVPAAVPVPPTRDQPRVMLRASGDAWMQVKDKAGTVLLNRTLHQGDTWPVPPTPGLLLTTGNAAATEVLVDGAVVESLGGTGAVRHDIALDADQLKIATVAPAGPPAAGNTAPRPAQ